jgi:hypothetical protein
MKCHSLDTSSDVQSFIKNDTLFIVARSAISWTTERHMEFDRSEFVAENNKDT